MKLTLFIALIFYVYCGVIPDLTNWTPIYSQTGVATFATDKCKYGHCNAYVDAENFINFDQLEDLAEYHFKIVFEEKDSGDIGTLEWKQIGNPLAFYNVEIPTSDVVWSAGPADELVFKGLSLSSRAETLLDGDLNQNWWWFSIGYNKNHNGGQPIIRSSNKLIIARKTQLFVESSQIKQRKCAIMNQHSHISGLMTNANDGGENDWLEEMNDQASNIHVEPGCSMTVWEHRKFEGEYKIFLGPEKAEGAVAKRYELVGTPWNDRISSYKCSCPEWTAIYSQTGPSHFAKDNCDLGNCNHQVDGENFINFGLLDSDVLSVYHFKLVMEEKDTGAISTLEWHQLGNPLSFYNTEMPINDVIWSEGASADLTPFKGLSRSSRPETLLDGDLNQEWWWFSIGFTKNHQGGQPMIRAADERRVIAQKTQLFVESSQTKKDIASDPEKLQFSTHGSGGRAYGENGAIISDARAKLERGVEFSVETRYNIHVALATDDSMKNYIEIVLGCCGGDRSQMRFMASTTKQDGNADDLHHTAEDLTNWQSGFRLKLKGTKLTVEDQEGSVILGYDEFAMENFNVYISTCCGSPGTWDVTLLPPQLPTAWTQIYSQTGPSNFATDNCDANHCNTLVDENNFIDFEQLAALPVYHFKLVMEASDTGFISTLEWKQEGNPLGVSNTEVPTSDLIWSDGSIEDLSTFKGLSLSSRPETLLDGDLNEEWWWFSIGYNKNHNYNGIIGQPVLRAANEFRVVARKTQLFVATSQLTQQTCAVMNQHSHITGIVTTIQNGGENNWMEEMNDHASNVYIMPGCSLTVFEHRQFEGESKIFENTDEASESQRYELVGTPWNDRISSYKCSCVYPAAPVAAPTCDMGDDFKFWNGIQGPGASLGMMHADSKEECAQSCLSHSGCRAFTYNTNGSRECWLKAQANTISFDENKVSGARCDHFDVNLPVTPYDGIIHTEL